MFRRSSAFIPFSVDIVPGSYRLSRLLAQKACQAWQAVALAVATGIALAQPVAAQTANQVFEQGLDAYDRSDFARAAVLFQQSCDDGETSACSNLAVLYMTGRGVAADPARGIALFEAACRLGSSEGCDNAATARRRAAAAQPRPQTVTTASTIQGSVEACLDGSQADCVRAGRAYTLGEGVAVDHAIARPLNLRACDGGDMNACSWAGVSFETGEGGSADLAQAVLYYRRACDGNLRAGGCGNLGRFYELAGDYELALTAYTRACTDRNLDYCRQKAQVLHRLGRISEALPLLERTCAADIGSACALLGYTEAGRENWEASSAAYNKACNLGVEAQCAYARQLAGDLAQRRAWHAERAAERAALARLIQAGNTAGAADYAVYQLRSGPMAREVVESAVRRNAMGSLNIQTLYVLASWFRDGPAAGAVSAELRRRGTGLEGTFGPGTNQPGMAEARWRASNGGGASAYSGYRPSQSSTPAPPVLSSAEAASQTRDRYRTAHCQMAGSSTGSSVCR
jgi:TPR repeat protein